MLIAITSTVRTSYVNLRMFVNYYLNSGVDKIILFFDDPNDESIERLKCLDKVTCVRCRAESGAPDRRNIEQRQLTNASAGLEMARNEGMDWIIHVDADELISVPERNVKSYLKRLDTNVDAVRFPTLEAVPNPTGVKHFFEDVHWFRVGNPRVEATARALGCHNALEYGYFKGHRDGKTATRTRSPVKSIGIHVPIAQDGQGLRVMTSSEAFTLHFDCCTFDEWKLKWLRRCDGTAIALEMRPDRRRQLSDFLAAFHTGSEALLQKEYIRQRAIPPAEESILVSTGLLKKIYLSSEIFRDPSAKNNTECT